MSDTRNEKIKHFLEEKIILTVTDSSTDRSIWKNYFKDLEINPVNILNANTQEEALQIIDQNNVHIILTSYLLQGHTAEEIIKRHLDKFPNRNERLIFLMTENTSMSIASFASENSVDGLILKPYNLLDLDNILTDSFIEKIRVTQTDNLFYITYEKIHFLQFEQAEKSISDYKATTNNAANTSFLRGFLAFKKDDLINAITHWADVLNFNPIHHKALHCLFNAHIDLKQYKEAYEYAEILCNNYPINPNRIPDYIKVSIATNNYESVVSFCKMIMSIDTSQPGLQKPIAAGLAISGKFLSNSNEHFKIASESSTMALNLCEPNSIIQYTALQNLLRVGDFKIAREIIDLVPTDDMSDKLLVIDLLITELEQPSVKTYEKAQKMISQGIKDVDLYVVLYTSAKSVGKNDEYLEEILFEGTKVFSNLLDSIPT